MATIQADVTLVGGGIMSATLAMLLQRLDPGLQIVMLEQLPEVALESTAALHNAGTGHAGYCELNYTPADSHGAIDIRRALEINAAFELSLQFWSHLVEGEAGKLQPESFINRVPHLSAVWEKTISPTCKRAIRRCSNIICLAGWSGAVSGRRWSSGCRC